MSEQQTVGLPAAICFAVACALVLVYVLLAQPGVRDSSVATSRASDQRPSGAVQATGPVEGRNELRLRDLAALKETLDRYAKANDGAFVSSNGNLQTLCTYQDLDAGCALSQYLNPLPADPAGRNFGYYYLSDGKSYVLGARWEGDQPPADGFDCPADFHPEPRLIAVCITGGR
jgi:hypothetical protein